MRYPGIAAFPGQWGCLSYWLLTFFVSKYLKREAKAHCAKLLLNWNWEFQKTSPESLCILYNKWLSWEECLSKGWCHLQGVVFKKLYSLNNTFYNLANIGCACFTPICSTPFRFSAPCQFTPLLNFHPIIFCFICFGWLHTRMLPRACKTHGIQQARRQCAHCILHQSLCTHHWVQIDILWIVCLPSFNSPPPRSNFAVAGPGVD
jgi:hypothetical protein